MLISVYRVQDGGELRTNRTYNSSEGADTCCSYMLKGVARQRSSSTSVHLDIYL